MNPLLERLGGYPLAAFQDLKAELLADGRPVHDFSIGDPVEPTPAFIRQALVDGLDPVSQYPTAAGMPAVREAIAGWVRRRFGISVDPDRHVLPTAGSKEAIFHLPLAVLDPQGTRRAVVWGDPGYQVYERGQLFAGGTSDPVVLSADTGWRLALDELDARRLQSACIVWVNYPHNPTGAAVDIDYYRRSLRVCRDQGVLLASDECYADIYPGDAVPPPSLLQAVSDDPVRPCESPDLTGVVVAFSLSKRSGMTGYRCGALVGDPDVIAAQRVLRPNIGTASPAFVQRAAIAAWSDDEHARDRRSVFNAKRVVMLGFLRDAGLRVSGSDATFYLWFAAPDGDDAAYAAALLRRRVIASPGRVFGKGGTGWLRLALVPSVQGCEDAAEIWRNAIACGALPGHQPLEPPGEPLP